MESSSSMTSLTDNPSKILRIGSQKLINTATRMSSSYLSEINPILRPADKSRQNRERLSLTLWALSFWRHQPRMQSTLRRHSLLFPTKLSQRCKANPEQAQEPPIPLTEHLPPLKPSLPKKINRDAADRQINLQQLLNNQLNPY